MPGNFSKTYNLYAPADSLENIDGEELALLFDTYEKYATPLEGGQGGDPSLIDKLIAILYRKSKVETPEQLDEDWYGDRRQPYNEASVRIRQEQISKLPLSVKNAIFFWFLSCRMAIIESYPGVFKTSDGRERQGGDYGWWGTFRHIAGNLKDITAISKMNHRELLAELSFLQDEAMKAEMRADMAGIK